MKIQILLTYGEKPYVKNDGFIDAGNIKEHSKWEEIKYYYF